MIYAQNAAGAKAHNHSISHNPNVSGQNFATNHRAHNVSVGPAMGQSLVQSSGVMSSGSQQLYHQNNVSMHSLGSNSNSISQHPNKFHPSAANSKIN
jgi:hypothetical protein